MAVYQLITIRIDPFGARHIITTPRCLAACVATWVIAQVLSIPYILQNGDKIGTILANFGFSLVITITGICYCLIYRAVAKRTGGGMENQIAERCEENKKILRTFGFVYGTNAAFAIFVVIVLDILLFNKPSYCLEGILRRVVEVLLTSNSMVNSIIYWWRLKEFRSILSTCYHAKFRRATVPVI